MVGPPPPFLSLLALSNVFTHCTKQTQTVGDRTEINQIDVRDISAGKRSPIHPLLTSCLVSWTKCPGEGGGVGGGKGLRGGGGA